ncbi:hypothetical protein [Streptomyces albogriseolus]|uniref:hypothetical protein n=1 Tax=Streptomyces albogriseolus TaxID=1887 RepID=UPI003F53FA87
MALQASTPRRGGDARVPAPAGEGDAAAAGHEDAPQSVPVQGGDGEGAEHVAADAEPAEAAESRSRGAAGAGRRAAATDGAAATPPRKRGRTAARRPSGRERHDEKITVYVSAEELMDLEHARLVLRGEHGLAVDRGRIVREAVAVVLADLESRGDASILVRRLRGR